MKKINLLVMMLAIFASIGFIASCSSDDDKPSSDNYDLVGSWKATHSWGYEVITFKKDGTGILTEVDNEEYYDDTFVEEFKWSLKNDIITISWYDDEYYEWETDRWEILLLDAKTLTVKEITSGYYDYEDEYMTFTRVS